MDGTYALMSAQVAVGVDGAREELGHLPARLWRERLELDVDPVAVSPGQRLRPRELMERLL
jgi:hypothetical protein